MVKYDFEILCKKSVHYLKCWPRDNNVMFKGAENFKKVEMN